jgi:hypothetical protein
MKPNVGGIVSCRLRAASYQITQNYKRGGNASN